MNVSPQLQQILAIIEREFQSRGFKSYVIAVHDTPADPQGRRYIDARTQQPFNAVVIRDSNPGIVKPFIAEKLGLGDGMVVGVAGFGGGFGAGG